ncbi:DNA-directed RNA polymerase subunit K [Candidatus Woesearchaeota archaeon]|jgi:DNA-directed RNA polymerase subunit K/omega|nr:DNA-directed RNA polymerase subunit K [Candidatus Woesearchaeota archaeon]MBT6519081.1 DNA-directed RNA polymerase subunit K [Candidatus Woesearchaeota archaeon]MBT7367024.1 DNA-directed RNA polymerase subunit K [Candidatus Woesearchaeota archaeon]
MAKETTRVELNEKITRFEKARVLGSRALQIAMGAPFLVKLSEEDLETMHYDPLEIAKKELEEGAIPMTVIRPLPYVEAFDKKEKKAK